MAGGTNNRLLATRSDEEVQPLVSRLVDVALASGQILAAPYASLKYGYFITSGMASASMFMLNGAVIGAHVIGSEGFVGLPLIFGTTEMEPATKMMQIPGRALRIQAADFLQAFNRAGRFQTVMRRYGLASLEAIMQSAACNSLHPAQQRMARCLLEGADRAGTEFHITHDAIAHMLGNRRATITSEAEKLQCMGIIRLGYRRIVILERRKLEELACECYKIRKDTLEKVFTAKDEAA